MSLVSPALAFPRTPGMNPSVAAWIESIVGEPIRLDSVQRVTGGCIHDSRLVETESGRLVFVKQNALDQHVLFETEKQSLELLANAKTIRVPQPYATAVLDEAAVFAMEGIRLRNRQDSRSQEQMGRDLARLHSIHSSDGRFGAAFDNFIGATPQPNGWMECWADFFVERRLDHQFRLAAALGQRFSDARRLLSATHEYLRDLEILPSLLHGDLWGGNASFDESGNPVLFDPATYFGDQETDIAFTRLFGGFGPDFYASYRETVPEPEPVRHEIYNLYHLLNHFVLFRGGYAQQADASIRSILGAI